MQVPLLLKTMTNKVIVMENDVSTQRSIRKSLKQLGYRVKTVGDPEEAICQAEREPQAYYVFDVHMGSGREQDGLTALERIKNMDNDIFVAVLSGYPRRYRQMAKRLNVDVFLEKSVNPEQDTLNIVRCMLEHARDVNDDNLRRLDHLLECDCEGGQRPASGSPNKENGNLATYRRLASDPQWLKGRTGKYIALVEGKVVGEDADRSELLLKVRKEYPSLAVFFTRIEEVETPIDIPTPLSIDD